MIRLPKIFASSVIRSTHRGDSHGGIYLIDLETEQFRQVVDWNNPQINWEGRGGDRGVRGLCMYDEAYLSEQCGNLLYAVAGNELFAFDADKDFLLSASYQSKFLKLTHEAWAYSGHMYICSGGTDTILNFDMLNKKWSEASLQHPKGSKGRFFDCVSGDKYLGAIPQHGGWTHMDSVVIAEHCRHGKRKGSPHLYYSGAYLDCMFRIPFTPPEDADGNFVMERIPLPIRETHNARPWRDGLLFNVSRDSSTYYFKDGKQIHHWRTPVPHVSDMTHTHLPHDHAVAGYTRGMVTYKDYVITGTSPAAINVWKVGHDAPIKTIQLTDDIRNSICGMCLVPAYLESKT